MTMDLPWQSSDAIEEIEKGWMNGGTSLQDGV